MTQTSHRHAAGEPTGFLPADAGEALAINVGDDAGDDADMPLVGHVVDPVASLELDHRTTFRALIAVLSISPDRWQTARSRHSRITEFSKR